jgi:hypothetical protein
MSFSGTVKSCVELQAPNKIVDNNARIRTPLERIAILPFSILTGLCGFSFIGPPNGNMIPQVGGVPPGCPQQGWSARKISMSLRFKPEY